MRFEDQIQLEKLAYENNFKVFNNIKVKLIDKKVEIDGQTPANFLEVLQAHNKRFDIDILHRNYRFMKDFFSVTDVYYMQLGTALAENDKLLDRLFKLLEAHKETIVYSEEFYVKQGRKLPEVMESMEKEIDELEKKGIGLDEQVRGLQAALEQVGFEMGEFKRRIANILAGQHIATKEEIAQVQAQEQKKEEKIGQDEEVEKILKAAKIVFKPKVIAWFTSTEKDKGNKPSFVHQVTGSLALGDFKNVEPEIKSRAKIAAKERADAVFEEIIAELKGKDSEEEVEEGFGNEAESEQATA